MEIVHQSDLAGSTRHEGMSVTRRREELFSVHGKQAAAHAVSHARTFTSVRAVLIVLAIVAAAAVAYIAATFPISKTYVSGSRAYSSKEVSDIFEQGFMGTNSFFLALRYNNRAVDVPFVDRVNVRMLDAHTVQITVKEKPIAFKMKADNGKYIYLSTDGVAQEITKTDLKYIPKVSGLGVTRAVTGEQITPVIQVDYKYMCKVMQLLQKYEIVPDSMKINNTGGIDLTFGKVTVSLGSGGDTDMKINTVREIEPLLSGRKGTIDLSNYTDESDSIVLK